MNETSSLPEPRIPYAEVTPGLNATTSPIVVAGRASISSFEIFVIDPVTSTSTTDSKGRKVYELYNQVTGQTKTILMLQVRLVAE
jgi:hypothetical protein